MLRRVTLPIALPGLVSSAIFCFVTSFGNVTLSVFLSGAREVTLPVQIFTYVEHSYDPTLAAVSTLVILVTIVVLVVLERTVGLEGFAR